MALNYLQTAQQKDELCTGTLPGVVLGSACRVHVCACVWSVCVPVHMGGTWGTTGLGWGAQGPQEVRNASRCSALALAHSSSLCSPSPSAAPSLPLFLP